MNETLKFVFSAITILVMLGGIVFTAGIMMAGIAENKQAITERKMSGKIVNEHEREITKLQVEENYGIATDKRQDANIEDIRKRIRKVEQKIYK